MMKKRNIVCSVFVMLFIFMATFVNPMPVNKVHAASKTLSKAAKDLLVGKWLNKNDSIEFFKNGKTTVIMASGEKLNLTYSLKIAKNKPNDLVTTLKDTTDGTTETITIKFIDDNTMLLDGDKVTRAGATSNATKSYNLKSMKSLIIGKWKTGSGKIYMFQNNGEGMDNFTEGQGDSAEIGIAFSYKITEIPKSKNSFTLFIRNVIDDLYYTVVFVSDEKIKIGKETYTRTK